MLLGELNDTQTVPLTGGLESILFPLGGIVAVFGVSARYDNDRDTIEIESSAAAGGGGAGRPPAVQLASQQYLYSLTSDGHAYGQFAQIAGAGARRPAARVGHAAAQSGAGRAVAASASGHAAR